MFEKYIHHWPYYIYYFLSYMSYHVMFASIRCLIFFFLSWLFQHIGNGMTRVSRKMKRKPRTENEREDRSYFNFAVWSIWKSRNSYVFNKKIPNPNMPMEIHNQTLEFMYCVTSPRNPRVYVCLALLLS